MSHFISMTKLSSAASFTRSPHFSALNFTYIRYVEDKPKMYEFLHGAKFCLLETKNGQLDRFTAKKKVLEKICGFL